MLGIVNLGAEVKGSEFPRVGLQVVGVSVLPLGFRFSEAALNALGLCYFHG